MIDQKHFEFLMNLYCFSLGAFGFYLLIREIAFLRKEANMLIKYLKQRRMKNNACNQRFQR